MPGDRNFFSEIASELGGELHQAFKDAAKSKAVPMGMQSPTTSVERDQAWRTRLLDSRSERDKFRRSKGVVHRFEGQR